MFTLIPHGITIEAGKRQRIRALMQTPGFFGSSKYVEPALIKWEISNPQVIGIDQDTGEIRGLAPGKSSIKASFMDDQIAMANVTVSPSGLSLKVNRGHSLAGMAPASPSPAPAPAPAPAQTFGKQEKAGALLYSAVFGGALIVSRNYLEKELFRK